MNELIYKYRSAKNDLAEAKARLLEAEIALYQFYKNEIPEEGSFKVEDLTIKTGFYQKWNQEALTKVEYSYPRKEKFPFSLEFKPDNRAISYIKDHRPDLYVMIEQALSLTPKKPSFSLKGEKNDD
jgi:hypothetical protein